MTEISTRLKDVVYKEIKERTLHELAEKSEIKQTSWANAFNGRQRPTSEMIEWVCQKWPQYAYWIAIGELPSEEMVHTSPKAEELKNGPDLVALLSKEPMNWTAEEMLALVMAWNEKKLSDEDEMAVKIGLEAHKKQQFLKTYLAEEIKKRKKLAKDSENYVEEDVDLLDPENHQHIGASDLFDIEKLEQCGKKYEERIANNSQ
jgi:uncharacterized protein YeaC (DUF1315 family)